MVPGGMAKRKRTDFLIKVYKFGQNVISSCDYLGDHTFKAAAGMIMEEKEGLDK